MILRKKTICLLKCDYIEIKEQRMLTKEKKEIYSREIGFYEAISLVLFKMSPGMRPREDW